MKKTLNILGWTGVAVTIFTLILTLLTTYQFTYIKYFDSYFTFQCSMFITMLLFGINMLDTKVKIRNMMLPLFCMFMAAGTMFFICMGVY